jgi:predicted transcriptional regulator
VGRGGAERRGRGELEAAVLAALWAADGPVTAAAVQEQIGADTAYTTVLTILTRLCDKGLLRRERVGRAHRYAPVSSEAEHAAAGMHTLLDEVGDRAEVLARFVSELSAEDERVLEQLLRGELRDGRGADAAEDSARDPAGSAPPPAGADPVAVRDRQDAGERGDDVP